MRIGNVILRDSKKSELVFSGSYADAKAAFVGIKPKAGQVVELSASDMRTKVNKGPAVSVKK